MGRYRKVSTCIHGDEKVRRLTRSTEATGRELWFFLLTGPHTTNIPGLFRTGVASLSEENGWSIESTARALGEILTLEMALFDPSARVMFLPRAIEHNAPESPNVIRAWRATFDELPDSPLKMEALRAFRGFFEARAAAAPAKRAAFLEAFAEAFPEAFPEGSPKACANPPERLSGRVAAPLPKGSPNQEQEQDLRTPPTPPSGGAVQQRAFKPTRAERKKAEEVRRAWGHCLHGPKCESYQACITAIVLNWREQAAAAHSARASPLAADGQAEAHQAREEHVA